MITSVCIRGNYNNARMVSMVTWVWLSAPNWGSPGGTRGLFKHNLL